MANTLTLYTYGKDKKFHFVVFPKEIRAHDCGCSGGPVGQAGSEDGYERVSLACHDCVSCVGEISTFANRTSPVFSGALLRSGNLKPFQSFALS